MRERGNGKGETTMTYQTAVHAREEAVEAFEAKVTKEARDAVSQGKGIHHNPYDYTYEANAADIWDKAWRAAK